MSSYTLFSLRTEDRDRRTETDSMGSSMISPLKYLQMYAYEYLETLMYICKITYNTSNKCHFIFGDGITFEIELK